MAPFIVYMAKVSIGLIVFSIFFRLLLMRNTFFRFTRIVLWAGVVGCFLLPFFRLHTNQYFVVQKPIQQFEEFTANAQTVVNNTQIAFEADVNNTHVSPTLSEDTYEKKRFSTAFSWLKVILGIYLLGVVFMTVRFFISLMRLRELIRKNPHEKHPNYRLVICKESITPFSFFGWIVLSQDDYYRHPDEIILHEQMHLTKGHSVDLIILEIFLIVQWFNPAAWSLCKDLREIHEYEADNAVVNSGIDATKYQLLLIKKAVGEKRFTSIANSFNQSKIKNRITMMLRKKSTPWARLNVLMLVPAVASMLLAFSQPRIEQQATAFLQQDKPKNMVEQVQQNPYFYWEQVQAYCNEKNVSTKDFVKEFDTNNLIAILVNKKNELLVESFQMGKDAISSLIMKNNLTELKSQAFINKLSDFIAKKMNTEKPILITVTYYYPATATVLYILMQEVVPDAYEKAINTLSEKEQIEKERLIKKKPLLMICSLIPPPPPPNNANKKTKEEYAKQIHAGRFFNAEIVYPDKMLYKKNEWGGSVYTGFIDIDNLQNTNLKKKEADKLLITTHWGITKNDLPTIEKYVETHFDPKEFVVIPNYFAIHNQIPKVFKKK